MNMFTVTCAVLAAALPVTASAATEWAVFGSAAGNSQTGTFVDGRSVDVSAYYPGAGVILADTAWDSTPIVPGRLDSSNPPGINTITAATSQTLLEPGAVFMTMNFSNFTVNTDTLFGISDMFWAYSYRLELLDAQGAALPLTDVVVTNYNLDLRNFDFDADYNLSLDGLTGALQIAAIHDANNGSTYRHTGLALFSNLPVATKTVRILSGATFTQPAEGVNFYLAGSVSPVPAPATIWLLIPGLLGIARFARRRD